MDKRRRDDLRILILDAAAQGIEQAIPDDGTILTKERVHTRKHFREALSAFLPDIILADLTLPRYEGLTVLKDARELRPEIPLIFIADSLSATAAVELIHAGASDYVPRNELDRLPQAIRDALTREEGIRRRKASEHALREAMERLRLFRALIDQFTDGIEVIDPETLRFLDVNDAECRHLGYSRDELLNMTVLDIDPTIGNSDNGKVDRVFIQMGKPGVARFEGIHRRRDGSQFPVEISAQLIELDKPYALSIARDISDRKQTETEMLRLNRVLRTLNEANGTLLHTEDETRLMQDICQMIVRHGDYSLAWIGGAQNDADKSVQPLAVAGNNRGYVDGLQLSWEEEPRGNGPSGLAIRSGIVQIVQDVQNDPKYAPWRESALSHGFASCVALPLRDKRRVFGCLNIYSKDVSAFSESEVELLNEVANNLAFGLTNLRVRNERDQAVREREDYTERLRKSMEDAIQAVATVVEMRDLYTAGHQRRVADLGVAIAHELGMSDAQMHGVHLAGIVHDIGKIHIPAEILSKPASLSDIEYSLVKTHSQAGYDILKGIDFPWPIAQAVLQHHERMNGSGYPQGLEGDEILIEARILAVADVIESMSSHRPYRAGLGLEPALEEIRRNRGILYDENVVDACLRLFQGNRFHFHD